MSAERAIRVLIVDDYAVVRAGLRRLLDAEDDIETVAEAGDGERAVFEAMAGRPDVALIDLHMPRGSGLDAIPKIVELVAGPRVLVLSMHDDPRYVRAAFEAGATGYILKEAAAGDLVHAVREVAGGGSYLHPQLGARMLAAKAERGQSGGRERPVRARAGSLAAARSGAHEQGDLPDLYISVRTAKTHRAHIMRKLRLSTRADLVQYALAMRLVETEEP